MPLSSLSSGLVRLPLILRYSRSTKLHHVFKSRLHIASSSGLETVQSDVSPLPKVINLVEHEIEQSPSSRTTVPKSYSKSYSKSKKSKKSSASKSPPGQREDLPKTADAIRQRLIAKSKENDDRGKTFKERRMKAVAKKKGYLRPSAIAGKRAVEAKENAGLIPDFIEGGAAEAQSLPETLDATPKSSTLPHQPPADAHSVDTGFISQIPVNTEETLDVPTLSNDLSRVLFNPGVYQLQDPRSRVYNFAPYLQKIMPVHEFNWDALNPYITSSADHYLRDEAIKQKKRYIGSSSSMSGAMSQFHFLLSAWRPLNFSVLSKQMEGLTSFTQITRAPASIFLRYRKGVYAVDADKEHDNPNILMMHGKSMEKLLTLDKEEFETYRKPKEGENPPTIASKPESYHYSTVANFLLRSQLDAYDPRLPGTGMFDLKTRAVAGVRMYLEKHESGMGYQIRDRFGLWESYEREYYDMIRSAFLKYSLQVRMGRMDGIFVAYHNIARIFGFQYISISELDQALHGQADNTVGDREFKMSLKLLSELFDRATQAYPDQSLRFMFETWEPPKGSLETAPFMRVFAEVMTEDEIEASQALGRDKIDDYEDNVARGLDPREEAKAAKFHSLQDKISTKATPSTMDSTRPDTSFLDQILGKSIDSFLAPKPEAETKEPEPTKPQESKKERKLLCWKLKVYNEVNGYIVDRPEKITSADRWNVHYTIEEQSEGVQKLYNQVINKRRTMFNFEGSEDGQQNHFLRNIIKLNESGKKWRAEQNERDAGRKKVILYSSASMSEST